MLLRDFFPIGMTEADQGPKWHLVFPLGITRHRQDFPNGKVEFTADVLRSMAANFAREGKPERAVNYFHMGQSGIVAPVDAKIAAGWFSDVAIHDPTGGSQIDGASAPGLYIKVAWTKRAREFILADELRYLSPEFRLAFTDKRTGKDQGPTLLGVALLNDPYLTELPRVAASETTTPNGGRGENMNKLIKVLGLAENATEADVEKAVAELVAKQKENSTKLSENETAHATALAEVKGMVGKLTEQIGVLEKERGALVAERRQSEVLAFVEKLKREGKVTPAIHEDVVKMGISGGIEAIKFLEKLAPVVQMGEIGIPGEPGQNDKKSEAEKRFKARLAELEKGGMPYVTAFNQTKGELPQDFALYFTAEPAKK